MNKIMNAPKTGAITTNPTSMKEEKNIFEQAEYVAATKGRMSFDGSSVFIDDKREILASFETFYNEEGEIEEQGVTEGYGIETPESVAESLEISEDYELPYHNLDDYQDACDKIGLRITLSIDEESGEILIDGEKCDYYLARIYGGYSCHDVIAKGVVYCLPEDVNLEDFIEPKDFAKMAKAFNVNQK